MLLSASAYPGSSLVTLESFLHGFQSLHARFSQSFQDPTSDQVRLSSGQIYVKKPNRFRWEYDGDEGQLIVADGDRIWLVEPDLEQASHRAQAGALAGTPAWLLTGEGEITTQFTVSELNTEDGMQWLQLVPIDPDSQFEKLLVALEDGRLSRLQIEDKFGQLTAYRFSDLDLDQLLPDSLFQYEPPSHFDLIND